MIFTNANWKSPFAQQHFSYFCQICKAFFDENKTRSGLTGEILQDYIIFCNDNFVNPFKYNSLRLYLEEKERLDLSTIEFYFDGVIKNTIDKYGVLIESREHMLVYSRKYECIYTESNNRAIKVIIYHTKPPPFSSYYLYWNFYETFRLFYNYINNETMFLDIEGKVPSIMYEYFLKMAKTPRVNYFQNSKLQLKDLEIIKRQHEKGVKIKGKTSNNFSLSYDSKEVECCICMNDESSSSATIQLPCEHQLHFDCFYTWIHAKNSKNYCPLCRKFPFQEIRIVQESDNESEETFYDSDELDEY